jgi:alpha-1,2-mannosyltransferase
MRERVHGLLEALRSGAWLTRERSGLVAGAVLAASAIGVLCLVLTANGRNDVCGRPPGTDFSNVSTAGTAVLEGRPELPFDPSQQYAREQAIFGATMPFYGRRYPPFFLFIAGALALLPPCLAALALWQLTTFVLYLLGIRAILATTARPLTGSRATAPISEPLRLLLASGFPAAFINVGHGHNGFLTAALFGTALLVLDARPIIAAIFDRAARLQAAIGLLISLVLIAGCRLGIDVWNAFLASTRFTRTIVLENGENRMA